MQLDPRCAAFAAELGTRLFLTPLFRKVHTLLPSLSAYDGSFVLCYLQQAPALPRNLLPSISCTLHSCLTTALPYDPRKISQLALLWAQILCIKSLLISHIAPFPRGQAVNQPPLPPSLHPITAPISAPPLPWVPWPKCPLLDPKPILCPEEQWGFPKPLSPPSQSKPFLQALMSSH